MFWWWSASNKVKLATIVKGDPKAPFSIATTPRWRGGYYFFPWIAPLYHWSLLCWVLRKVASSTIFWVFGMTRPGIEPRSPRPFGKTLTIMPMSGVKRLRAYIQADIVKNDLLLFLSHKSMKTAGMLLDFKNDCCQILCRYIKLQSATSRYYSLPLTNMILKVERLVNVVLHCEALKNVWEWRKEGRLRNYTGNLLMNQKRNWYPWLEVVRLLMIRSSCIWSGLFVILLLFIWGLENLLFDLL